MIKILICFKRGKIYSGVFVYLLVNANLIVNFRNIIYM